MDIWTLKRVSMSEKATRGVLIDPEGEPYCVTLENPWKNNDPMISCIPEGEYTVIWEYSPKYDRYMYTFQNVQGRFGIRVHSGNYESHTKGCPLLGQTYFMNDDIPGIGNSRDTVKAFEKRLNERPFICKIINC